MRQDMDDEEFQPDMPPVECGAYLIDYLFEIGPVLSSGMGPSPITHGEIASWSALVGLYPQPWETRLLRRLSREYIGELHKAEKRDCPAPWLSTDRTTDKASVVKAMKKAFAKMDKL